MRNKKKPLGTTRSSTDKKKKSQKAKERFDLEAWEQEARRRSAWGEYVQTMNTIKLHEEEDEYQYAKQKGDTKKVEEIENKRKRITLLYIG